MTFIADVAELDGWLLGAMVGLLPTVSMIVCSTVFFYATVDPQVEASFNYFTAGLILAAVGMELFPMIKQGGDEGSMPQVALAITIGFSCGLLLVYGLDTVTDFIAGADDNEADENGGKSRSVSLDGSFTMPHDAAAELGEAGDGDSGDDGSSISSAGSGDNLVSVELSNARNRPSRWKLEAVHESTALIGLPEHRTHIREHLHEIAQSVQFIMEKSDSLGAHTERAQRGMGAASPPKAGNTYGGLDDGHAGAVAGEAPDTPDGGMSVVMVEETAELIDEEVHKLHYKLDHTRRLLEGSETYILRSKIEQKNKQLEGVSSSTGGASADWLSPLCVPSALPQAPPHPILWLSEHRHKAMGNKLRKLGYLAKHLLAHIDEGSFNVNVIQEIHHHIDEVEKHLLFFHEDVEKAFSKWHKKRELVTPAPGAVIPSSLVTPVVVDAMLDGFLIGITASLNAKAGLILGLANCIEMGFLGIALSIRIAKCTGSPLLLRIGAIAAPPTVMLLAAMVGGLTGESAGQHPMVLVAIVCFGVVVLLALVCNELLIEAAEGNRDDTWWVSLMTFVGIYVVLVMDLVVS